MDADEIDAWLEPGLSDDDDAEVWRTPRPRHDLDRSEEEEEDRPRGRRLWIGAAAALVWVVVALAFLGGDDGAATGPTAVATMPIGAPGTSGTAAPVAGVDGGAPSPAPTAAPPSEPMPSDATTDPPTTTDTSTTAAVASASEGAVPAGSGDGGTGDMDAAAARGVREALAAGADGTDRYLEWAVPVARRPIAPDVDVITLEALWLEGADGVYNRTVSGRWAVPVSLDGVVLATPWAIPARQVPAVEPVVPTLRQRVDEAQTALEGGGWSELTVHASEAHPLLPGTWLVLVDGTDPAGIPRTGAVLWLEDDVDLRVLGGAGT